MIRETITQSYLERIGIGLDKIKLMPDCAFVLDTKKPKGLEEKLIRIEGVVKIPIIGISVNAILNQLSNEYLDLMVQTVDYLIQEYDCQVIFVPHVISSHKICVEDDRVIAKKIYNLATRKDRIILLEDDYNPEELKGIIALSTVFIGGRMHANIAALSNNIPTIAMSWNNKYKGIMTSLKQEKYVVELENLNYEELISMINELWKDQDAIRKTLKIKIKEQEFMVMNSGKLIADELIPLKKL